MVLLVEVVVVAAMPGIVLPTAYLLIVLASRRIPPSLLLRSGAKSVKLLLLRW